MLTENGRDASKWKMFTKDGADVSDMPFCKALIWQVHDPDEALSIAAYHRCKANELRERGRAAPHDDMHDVCAQHAANLMRSAAARLRSSNRSTFAPCPPRPGIT